MPIDFPTSPTLNQTYSYNSRTWKWDGTGWKVDQPSITFTDITTALGYTPLSANGGTISGNLTVTGNSTVSGTLSVSGNSTVSGTLSDSGGFIRNVPQVSKTTSYTLATTDIGRHVSTNAAVNIPASTFSSGDAITIYNNSAASISVTSAAGVTTYLVGTATTGTRTLAQRGLATVLCVAANTFVISGGGLT